MKKLVWLLVFGLMVSTSGASLCANVDEAAVAADQANEAGDQETPAAKQYLCPMHPEVEQDQPGKCPKCGMELQEKTADEAEGAAETAADTETAEM